MYLNFYVPVLQRAAGAALPTDACSASNASATTPPSEPRRSLHCTVRRTLLPAGFRNRELREAVAPLRGMSLDDYNAGQMNYNLRRLRLRGLIERIFRTQRYRLSAEGLCIALAYYCTQARVLGPVLSATLDGQSTPRLQAAVAAYDREVGHLWEGHTLAA